jgi:hypothetical protein
MDSLARNGLLLFVLLGLHTVDHAVNQPSRDVPALGGVVGLIGFAIVAAATILALRRSSYAPEAAVLAGAATVLGLLVVHVLPDWTALSDPYWDFDANALSWILLLVPLAAAVSLTLAGLKRLNARPAAIA